MNFGWGEHRVGTGLQVIHTLSSCKKRFKYIKRGFCFVLFSPWGSHYGFLNICIKPPPIICCALELWDLRVACALCSCLQRNFTGKIRGRQGQFLCAGKASTVRVYSRASGECWNPAPLGFKPQWRQWGSWNPGLHQDIHKLIEKLGPRKIRWIGPLHFKEGKM